MDGITSVFRGGYTVVSGWTESQRRRILLHTQIIRLLSAAAAQKQKFLDQSMHIDQ